MAESEMKPLDRFVDFVYEATRIFKAFSMALDAKKLVFALAGVVLWSLGAMFISALLSIWWWIILVAAAAAGTFLVFVIFAKSDMEVGSKNFILLLVGSIIGVWAVAIILYFAMKDAAEPQKAFICQVLWGLAVASFFGTAIARIAAVNAATEDSMGFRDAMRFALKKLATSVWTLLVPVVAVIAYSIVLTCFGILGRLPYFGAIWYVIIGIIYIVFLMGGLFFAVVLLLYVPGLALFQPAIAAEGQDSYDAISRAYGYIFNRPWRFAFYSFLAYLYGRIILSVAAWVVTRAGWIANAALERGVGKAMTASGGKLDLGAILGGPLSIFAEGPAMRAFGHVAGGNVHESFSGVPFGGSWLIVFWQYVLLMLFMAFATSLFYCLVTQIYFLMRKASYGTGFEEVYIEQPEEEQFAGEFAEAPKPTEPPKPTLEDLSAREAKGTAERAKAEEDKYRPIDLSGTEKKLDEDEDEEK